MFDVPFHGLHINHKYVGRGGTLKNISGGKSSENKPFNA